MVTAQGGVTVRGRVTWGGQPAANIKVGLAVFSDKEPFTIMVVQSDGRAFYQPESRKVGMTVTDTNGEYVFHNVSKGKYQVDVVYSLPATKVIDVKDSNEFVSVIELPTAKSAHFGILGEVSVIATGTRQNDGQTTKSVDVIDAQEMRDRADFSLAESLKTVPGFRVQQLGGFGRTATIKTRGLRNPDTAVLIDGIRFRDASTITGDASAFLSDLTLTSIDRLEVLRGSGSSLYGTNAIGGVVDFITPLPKKGFHGQFGSEFGGYGLQRYRGNLSNGTDKFGFTIGASRTLYTKGIDDDDDARNTNIQSRIEYNPFSKTNISGRVFVGDSFVKLNSSPDIRGTLPALNSQIIKAGSANFAFDANDPDAFQRAQFFSGQIALNQVFTDNVIFKSSYQFLRTSRKNTNGVLGVGFQPFGGDETSIFTGLINTFNSRLDWTAKNNLITFGYEFENEIFRNRGLSPFASSNFNTEAKQSSNTIYVQDQLSFLGKRLQISGAFRAQFFSLKTPAFSSVNAPYTNLTLDNPPTSYTADGSVAYFFERSGTKLRAHVGNGYRVPSLYERFGTFYDTFSVPNQFVALGDPGLKPEKSYAFDAGIDQSLFSNKARLSATYFYTRLQDIIGFENVVRNIGNTPRFFGGYTNVKGGISRGAEFSIDMRPSSSTNIFASYTFTNSDQRVPQVSGSGVFKTLGVPDHQFTLVATQRFGKRFALNFDFLGTSSYLAPIFSNSTFTTYIYRFKGARKGDLTASYEIPAYNEKLKFRIFGTVENLFGYDYFENGFRTFDRTGRMGLAVSF